MEEASATSPKPSETVEQLRSVLKNMKIDEAIIGLVTTVFSKNLGETCTIDVILNRFDHLLSACMQGRRIEEGREDNWKEIDEAFINSRMEKVISDCFEDLELEDVSTSSNSVEEDLNFICSVVDRTFVTQPDEIVAVGTSEKEEGMEKQDAKQKAQESGKKTLPIVKLKGEQTVKVDRVESSFEEKDLATVVNLDFNRKVLETFDFVKLKKSYVFKVTHIHHPYKFYMEYVTERDPENGGDVFDEDQNLRASFWKDLQFLYHKEDIKECYKLKSEPLVGRLYVYYDRNNTFERVRVVETEMHNLKVRVLRIDIGDTRWVNQRFMYELAYFFSHPPAKSFECSLSSIRPIGSRWQWEQPATDKFREIALGKRVLGIIHEKTIQTFDETDVPQCKMKVSLIVLDEDKKPDMGKETVQAQLCKSLLASTLSKSESYHLSDTERFLLADRRINRDRD